MDKFSGQWSEDKINDLLISHKNRTHSETAKNLSEKWKVLVTRDMVKNKYNSLNQEKVSAGKSLQADPVKSREYYNREQDDSKLKDKRVYVVTSAIAGCPLNEKFYNSLISYCNYNNAKLVVLPQRGAISKDEEYNEDVLKYLEQHFYTDYIFNENISALDIGVVPTQVDPLSGLERIAEKSSIIIASPKQNLNSIPSFTNKIPHLLQSTGSITLPSYSENRIGRLADNDHVSGAIILEVENKQIYHTRQIQVKEDGIIYDLNKEYNGDRIKETSIESFVLGDLHLTETDEVALNSWYQVIDLTKPKSVFCHDTFTGGSISHHLLNNMTEKANRPIVVQTLENELNYLGNFFLELTKKYPKIDFYIVKSNHDEFLDRFLNEMRYINTPENYKLSLQLALYKLDGLDPIEQYINKKFGKMKNLIWLKRGQDLTIKGVTMSQHGDQGNNSGPSSPVALEKSLVNCIVGHSHSPKILRNFYQVGTSTKLRLGYNVGGSSWLQTSAILYKNGTKTLITNIEGKWRND